MANSWPKWRRRAQHINERLSQGATIEELANEYDVSPKTITNRIAELKADGLIGDAATTKAEVEALADREIQKHGHSVNVNEETGTHKSDLLLKVYSNELKDTKYLLEAHGYDPKEWDLKSSTSKIWNVYSKDDYVVTLYSSTITVIPKVQGCTFEELLQAFTSNIKPVHIQARSIRRETDRMLEISLFDMHFGNNAFQHYRETQQEIIDLLNTKHWREVLFVVGQDLLHHDNFKSSTANGTIIANADMPRAVEDAKAFYYPLIELAGERAKRNVKIIYSKGNHDESMSYMFVQVLKERYPQLKFDDAVRERKVHVYGRNFVGFTHGDKMPRKEITRLFPQEFPIEWSQTIFREVHAGDLHREDLVGKDEWGVMFRTLSTANQTDQWHEDKGFTTAHKRFMLFEYSPERLKHIHYV